MLPRHVNKYLAFACRLVLVAAISFFAAQVFADTSPPPLTTTTNVSSVSAETMLTNISTQIPTLMRLVTAIAYVMGMFLIIRGIVRLKHMGEMRTMMSHEHSLTAPLAFITVGALLLYLPTTVNVGLSTFWTDPNPYGYMGQTDQWSQFFNVCFTVIQFIGAIAIIRGLVSLSHVGGQGHQGGLKTGLTQIIGGIFCVNIYQFVQVILNTLGIQT